MIACKGSLRGISRGCVRFVTAAVMLPMAVMLLEGCSGDVVNSYSEYNTLPPDGWKYTRVESFPLSHRDSVCAGTLLVGLRHSGDYPFTDVQLEVDYTAADGRRHADTVTVQLADRYGKWLGKGVGNSFQITDTVQSFTHANGTVVKVRHLMRCDTLHGISQVGIFFYPKQNR